MNCCILYRVNGGKLQFVATSDAGDICEFPDMDAAISYADQNGLFESGQADYQIVELDEL